MFKLALSISRWYFIFEVLRVQWLHDFVTHILTRDYYAADKVNPEDVTLPNVFTDKQTFVTVYRLSFSAKRDDNEDHSCIRCSNSFYSLWVNQKGVFFSWKFVVYHAIVENIEIMFRIVCRCNTWIRFKTDRVVLKKQ